MVVQLWVGDCPPTQVIVVVIASRIAKRKQRNRRRFEGLGRGLVQENIQKANDEGWFPSNYEGMAIWGFP